MDARLRFVARTSVIPLAFGRAAADTSAKDIIVPGPSIRGVAPAGSNFASVGHQPFVNTATVNGAVGYDSFSANPLGRVVSIGVRTKF